MKTLNKIKSSILIAIGAIIYFAVFSTWSSCTPQAKARYHENRIEYHEQKLAWLQYRYPNSFEIDSTIGLDTTIAKRQFNLLVAASKKLNEHLIDSIEKASVELDKDIERDKASLKAKNIKVCDSTIYHYEKRLTYEKGLKKEYKEAPIVHVPFVVDTMGVRVTMNEKGEQDIIVDSHRIKKIFERLRPKCPECEQKPFWKYWEYAATLAVALVAIWIVSRR